MCFLCSGPGNHQLGDVTLRLQSLSSTNASSWAMFGSSWAGGTHNSVPLPGPYPPTVIASDDITALLNSTPANDRIQPSIPLSVRVSRTYASVTDLVSGDVALQMTINVTAITDTVSSQSSVFCAFCSKLLWMTMCARAYYAFIAMRVCSKHPSIRHVTAIITYTAPGRVRLLPSRG